ncbi:hypothetical protein N0752_23340 [Pseudomonas aeruginosa]|nr:hypothetical protein [Pseudomonas aeruginosa]MCS8829156.1 hypothetical protein [Pseudomonas aeruginosa]MCS8874024.1 hypothetical protein [Pseudomonas aeruginosa]MCS8907979.1 hypothetical protein [Pseudomonas aeruginosa]MCS8914030.1 hypothetical protein [Pseudomonas aeruginosa]
MFVTNPSFELLRGILRGSLGDQQWVTVEQDIMWPWFYLQVVSDDVDDTVRNMRLVSSVQEFEDFLQSLSKSLWIEQVQVVTPHALNGAGRWLMEPLLEVSTLVDEKGVEVGHRFEVEGGRFYSTVSAARAEHCSKSTLIFSAAAHLQI